jgi:hypothetical protein
MTKDQGSPGLYANTPGDSLLPRQWWFWSTPLRATVAAHTFPLPFEFLFWCHKHRSVLIGTGLVAHREIRIPDPRAPITYELNWISPDHMASVVSLWELDTADAAWFARSGLELPDGWETCELPWKERCEYLLRRGRMQ